MIVRNSIPSVGEAITSIRPWVDEVIVVDTGSVDQTAEIAASLGARVHRFQWCDDFSAARNTSLNYATGKWLFWMDSDDTIDESNGRRLQDLARTASDEVTAFVLQVHCPGRDGFCDTTVVDHVKLFRNLPELRFEGRIHEQILPSIRRVGGHVEWTDVFVVHSGADLSIEGRARKYARDLRILQRELSEQPDHPFTLFNLGMTYADMRHWHDAIGFLARSIAVSVPTDSHVRKAYALLVSALTEQGFLEEAALVCHKGRDAFPDDVELCFRQGLLAHRLGRHDEAIRCYRDVLRPRQQRYFSSFDHGILSYKTRYNLALVYMELTSSQEAEREWRTSIEETPHFEPAWRALVELLLGADRPEDVTKLAADCGRDGRRSNLLRWIEARLAEHRGDLAQAEAILRENAEVNPHDAGSLDSLCRVLFAGGKLFEAEEYLARLTTVDQGNGAAHFNLGVLYSKSGRKRQAIEAFRLSLDARPQSFTARLELGEALISTGDIAAAAAIWREALWCHPVEAKQAGLVDRLAQFTAIGNQSSG